MARIRSLKPDFFEDEDLAELTFWMRILFEGLWCYADREGRLEDRPLKLKTQILPYDKIDIEKGLTVLAEPKKHSPKHEPFIVRYEVDGNKYIQIINFHKHQHPHPTEKESMVPPFNRDIHVKNMLNTCSGNGAPGDAHYPLTSNLTQISFFNLSWKGIGEDDKKAWTSAYPACDIDLELKKMAEWLKANPSKKKSNYRRFITNWLTRAQDRGGTNRGEGRGEYKPSKTGRYIPPIGAEKELEKKFLAEYEEAQKKFMAAKGYKTEDEIPFDQIESFGMFKARRIREMKYEARERE